MRILMSCLQSLKQHPIASYEQWRFYLTKGCEEAGIAFVEVPGIDWAEALLHAPGNDLDQWRARTWEAVLSFVRREQSREPFDFFLSYLYPGQVEPAAIIELQRIGIPCVNFFCDNFREFRRVPDEYRPFALHWVPEFEALPMYRLAGLRHLHAPMPCWVAPELRSVPTAETEPPTFIGSPDLLRRDLFGRAFAAGADFIIRGPGWIDGTQGKTVTTSHPKAGFKVLTNQLDVMRVHGAAGLYHKMANRLFPLNSPEIPPSKVHRGVSNEDYVRISREAEVVIGVNRVSTLRASNRHPLTYSRLRDLEAPMLGACYLTEWTEGLGELYELGAEIETYRTPEELAVKIVELKKDPTRRRGLRERGQKRALADHSVARSLGRISEKLSLAEKARAI